MNNFSERTKEINALYTKAIGEEEYVEIIEKTQELADEMKKADCTLEEIAEAIYSGLWAKYYHIRKFFQTDQNVAVLKEKVLEHYQKIRDPLLKVEYGYLLAIILSELEENTEEAEVINNEIRQIARDTGNISAVLREINARALRTAKDGNHKEAVEIFNEIEALGVIPEEALTLAGNIINNRGASKIRGDIDPIGGAEDLLLAADYYLQEKEPPRKHLDGLRNRLREAREKLAE